MGPMKYGEAIELIKKNVKLVMYRMAWHGVQLGKKMYIRHLGGAQQPKIVFNTEGGDQEEIELDTIFLFISGENTYSWTASQHDQNSNDWMILEI